MSQPLKFQPGQIVHGKILVRGPGGRELLMAERPLVIVGQGDGTINLYGVDTGVLEALTGSPAGPRPVGGGDDGEPWQGICLRCQTMATRRCPECGAWCHENCQQESGCYECHQGRLAQVQPAPESSPATQAKRRGIRSTELQRRRGAFLAYLAGFVCGAATLFVLLAENWRLP